MGKAQKALATTQTIDLRKPLVKPVVNNNDEIARFIETRMKHVPYAKMRVVQVYQSHDKKVSRFRVNWYKETTEGITTKTNITSSQYVQVDQTDNGLSLTDLTKIEVATTRF
jgi:hypothetical protein